MFDPSEYELVDFGEGRKLERFGPYLLDRPSSAAAGFAKSSPRIWSDATARYDREEGTEGTWSPPHAIPDAWQIKHQRLTFELRPSGFGHLGVFPEQAANWDWLDESVRSIAGPLKILNLFAYTGGSTLAAAAAGAEVVHVDAAKNIVSRARGNAERSRLAEAPIRWITEDAPRFVRRELKRGNQYDGVILDPPSYGHGPKGEVWQIDKHLDPLLEDCAELTRDRCRLCLVTCHWADLTPQELARRVRKCFGFRDASRLAAGTMYLTTRDGRQLPSGLYVRYAAL